MLEEIKNIKPSILYEDSNFVAVNKPAGLLVHGARSMKHETKENASGFMLHASGEPTLVDWLLERYPEIRAVGDDPETRPGIVHRLDKDTSGVLLVARNQNYFEYLKKLFQSRDIKKTYVALVRGKVQQDRGVIDAPIGIKSGTTKRSIHSSKMQKEAVTEYRVLRWLKGKDLGDVDSPVKPGNDTNTYTLLEVSPKTGRTHQIRVHLASIGHPIVGDVLYGKKLEARGKEARKGRLMLHALSIEFVATPGEKVSIEAPLPTEFKG